MKLSILFLLLSSFRLTFACTDPTKFDEINGEISTDGVFNTLNSLQIPYLFLPLADEVIGGLVANHESPIQFRLANIQGTNVYNVVAMYDDKALDIWGKEDNRICSTAFSTLREKQAHETVAAAYAFAYSGIKIVPKAEEGIRNVMENVLGLPMRYLDGTADISTPWGLAKKVIDEGVDFARTDGWNADGSLRNTYNRIPYSDFDYEDSGNNYTAYVLKNNNKKNKKVELDESGNCVVTPSAWWWEPLLESDESGYSVRQEHVTPFCGFTGRLFGLSAEEYEAFNTRKPRHDYCFESDFVLERTSALATSDKQKMEVELFDSKFTSLLPLQIQWSIKSGLNEFEFWHYDMTLVIAMYDALMLVWRDKVLFNRIRPTTVVHRVKREKATVTYAGPFQGRKQVKGIDWQPYKRTMPHAEYPSGSSCICTAYAETLQSLTNSDALGVPVEQPIPAGSSKIEPGVTPAQDLVFTYTKWSEIQEICGASREYGGMHFSKAVSAGKRLCSGLAEKIVEKANLLKAGNSDGAMVDFNDRSIRIKTKVY